MKQQTPIKPGANSFSSLSGIRKNWLYPELCQYHFILNMQFASSFRTLAPPAEQFQSCHTTQQRCHEDQQPPFHLWFTAVFSPFRFQFCIWFVSTLTDHRWTTLLTMKKKRLWKSNRGHGLLSFYTQKHSYISHRQGDDNRCIFLL